MSIWVVLVYLLIFLIILLAVVGGVEVLRRLRAQRRLREELFRLQAELGDDPDGPDQDLGGGGF